MNQFGYEVTTGRIDPVIKAKWITALRSGKYNQSRETLRINGGFCCLGVLCDVIEPNGWVKCKDDSWVYYYKGKRQVNVLNDEILDLLGIASKGHRFWTVSICIMEDQSGEYNCTDHMTLTHLNDGLKLTFDQIADMINFFL